MRLSQSTTRRSLALAAFIAVLLTLVMRERRSSQLEAELTATQKRLQSCHEFSRQLALDLLRSEHTVQALTDAKSGSP
jgi:hypothetical protein